MSSSNPSEPSSLAAAFSDADLRRTILRALRLAAILTLIAAPIVWWKLGWQSAALLAIGALVSGSGIFEWLRLLAAMTARMDASPDAPPPKPLTPVLLGFFMRLALAGGVLYGSLKFLDGSIYALAAGLALGVFTLSVEGLRLVKRWTV